MAANKRKKKVTEFSLDCDCGEKAVVFELEKGYMARCPTCRVRSFIYDN